MKIWTIIKKELKRVFTDKRMIISLFLIPPLTIYLIYGIMGMSAKNENQKTEEYIPTVYVVNAPAAFNGVESFTDFLTVKAPKANYDYNSTYDEAKTLLDNKQIDLIIDFPADFSSQVMADHTDAVPTINLYYNINMTYSQNEYYTYSTLLSSYSNLIAGTRVDLNQLHVFDIGATQVGNQSQAKNSILSVLLPMLIVIYLMAGAMGVGMESVAGEKERGTIATLLVTPIKRSELAVGKIISISIIAILSSIASFIGLILVMPTLANIGGNSSSALLNVTYSIGDYGMVLILMLVAVLMFVALVVIASTFAKTVKEAGTLIMPLYLVVMASAFIPMFSQTSPASVTSYLIPVYNVSITLKAIFNFDIISLNWLAAVISTVVYTVILVFLIQKMFRSEKIMFNK